MNTAPNFTPGPWYWHVDHSGQRFSIRTPDRGNLIVMDFARKGMQGAGPRFAVMVDAEPRGRRGGILQDVDPATHPDGRLLVAAPDLHEAVLALVDVLVRCDADTMPNDLPHCTDEDWDAALAKGRAALAKVQS